MRVGILGFDIVETGNKECDIPAPNISTLEGKVFGMILPTSCGGGQKKVFPSKALITQVL